MVGMRIADVQEDIDHELITKEQIEDIINRAAAQASEDYRGRNPLLVCVLKGAVNTIAAFAQAMSIPVQMDFMSLSSYGSGTESSGTITVRQDLSTDVRGRHVLIVEDIIDSGITLSWLVDELKRRGAASVEIFALLEKPARRKVDVDVKYKGYEIPDEFVVGFGLDYDERYRNLDSIAVLKPAVYQGGQALVFLQASHRRTTAAIRIVRTTVIRLPIRSATATTMAAMVPVRSGSPRGCGWWSWRCLP